MTFQNKGDKKKKSQELPGRKHVIHKGLESQLALNSDPAETMEPRSHILKERSAPTTDLL